MIHEARVSSNTFRLILFCVALCLALPAAAETEFFTYQCRLTDEGGVPLTEPISMGFTLFDAPTGGVELWLEDGINVDPDEQGLVTVTLGTSEPIAPVFNDPAVGNYWLEITIQPDVGDPVILSPRRPINAAPLAMFSSNSYFFQGHDIDHFSLATHNHDGVYAAEVHNHDGVYADEAHNHDGVYADEVHDHDDRYFTESELQNSDGSAPNVGSNRVSWFNLTHVPADFADGVDETGGTISLDAAYDGGGSGAGRTIDANAGAVAILGAGGLDVAGGVELAGDLDVAGNVTFGAPDAAATLRIEGDNVIVLNPNGNGTGSVILPEDAIFALEIRDEPGLSNGHTAEVTFDGTQSTMTDLCTTTITTPEWGYILVTGTSTLRLTGNLGEGNTVYHQIDETEGGSYGASSFQIAGHTVAPSGMIFHSIHATKVYPKAAGTYTFRHEAMAGTPFGTKLFYNSKIEAVYLPTDYGDIVYTFAGEEPPVDESILTGDRR